MEPIQIDDRVAVGPQPSPADLRRLAERGFRSVVNLCTFNERGPGMDPAEEAEQARACGLEYRHLPVSAEAMVPKVLDDFSEEVQRLPTPVFVHCREGRRSAAFALAHSAMRLRLSADAAIQRGREAGLDFSDTPRIERLFRSYVDHHVGGPQDDDRWEESGAC